MSEFTLDRQHHHALLASIEAKSRVRHFAQQSLFWKHEVDGDEQMRAADAALQEWQGIDRACSAELERLAALKHRTT